MSPTTRLLTPTAPPLSPPSALTPSNNLYGSQTQKLTREKEEIKNAVQIELNNEIYELHNDPPKHELGDGLANIFGPDVEDILNEGFVNKKNLEMRFLKIPKKRTVLRK